MNDNTVAIIADGVGSTSLAAAQDLSAVLDDGANLRILPMVGAGGGRNLRDLCLIKSIDLAVTQTNLLASSALAAPGAKIVYLARLFNEEMHVLVRADSELVSIEQLGGRTVSLGEPGSGTQLVAHDVLARLGIAVREANMAAPEAIERLRAGDIEAVVLVGGKPMPALAGVSAGFRLLAVPFTKPLCEDFLPAALSSEDYPALIAPGRRIETLAVGTVLVTRDWPKHSERYHKIEKFVAAFFARIAALQAAPRHPKWHEVNLAASISGWTRSPAAEDWLARHHDLVEGERATIHDSRSEARAPLSTTSESGDRH